MTLGLPASLCLRQLRGVPDAKGVTISLLTDVFLPGNSGALLKRPQKC